LEFDARAADTTLHRFSAAALSDRRASASAHTAFLDRPGFRTLACPVTGCGIGPDFRITDVEIEQNGGGHNRYDAFSDPETGIMFFEPSDNARGCVQTIRASAREQNRLGLPHHIDRIQ
jgi:hypothetical protein